MSWEDLGFIFNEEFDLYAKGKTDKAPTIKLRPSQYTVEEVVNK